VKPGHYDENSGLAYVWHDVDYAVEVTNQALDFETTLEDVQKQVGTEGWPAEAVIEAASGEQLAFLTLRKYPFPEDGSPHPPELSIYINCEQAEHLRDWLDKRLQERRPA
jgi:hypothetical protein